MRPRTFLLLRIELVTRYGNKKAIDINEIFLVGIKFEGKKNTKMENKSVAMTRLGKRIQSIERLEEKARRDASDRWIQGPPGLVDIEHSGKKKNPATRGERRK